MLINPDGGETPRKPGQGAGQAGTHPGKPGDYDLGLPREMDGDPMAEEFRAFAAKRELSPELARELASFHLSQAQRVLHQRRKQTEDALRREWGPDFENNLAQVKRAVAYVDAQAPGFGQWVREEAGDNPALGRMLLWLARTVAEDSGPPRGGSHQPDMREMSPEEFITEAFANARKGDN
ncbi:hypothetical protein [Desulfohalovibrio reitneri]|uniref:hypothetical protein n=1 Tax=Desulfohalovibrio reitneri TaxID=1307759 RepID=UPI0004A7193E|nr:hypothetical protein [Desulfohalovibrio reitneri]